LLALTVRKLTWHAGDAWKVETQSLIVEQCVKTVAMTADTKTYGLRSAVLSPLETLAQSIALLAPTVTPAMILPLVFASAGNGTWLVFLLATCGLLCCAVNLSYLTAYTASPGSLYSYSFLGLGRQAAMLTGWALMFAYLMGGAAALVGFANYTNATLSLAFSQQVHPALLLAICSIITWLIACRDIRLSTALMLCLECLSILLIAVVLSFALYRFGAHFDLAQLELQSVTADKVKLGLVLAIFSFVGFESASTLGTEATNAHKSIAQAMRRSVILSGVFFVLASYAEVVGFAADPAALAKTNAPLQDIAIKCGAPLLAVLTDIGAAISFFSCVLAAINASARVLFFMSHDGIFSARLAQAHATNRTPHVAVTATAVLLAAVPAVLTICGYPLMDVYGWIGTISTYGFIVAYILACISVPLYLRRVQKLRLVHIAVTIVTVGFMVLAFVGNVYPAPAAPYNWLPYLFLAYMLAGLFWYRHRAKRHTVST